MVKDPNKVNFSYRDNLWRGADLLATGIASFGHASGVHYQNVAGMEDYLTTLEKGELPLGRAYKPTQHQLLVREMILLLKRGYIEPDHFVQKFGVDPYEHWKPIWDQYVQDELVTIGENRINVTRRGLLRVDSLLPPFFEPEHQNVRYT